MQKVLIDNPRAYEAVKGDIFELHFAILNFPVLSEWHKNYIKGKLESDPHVRVKAIQYVSGDMIVTIEVVSNPLPLMFVIGSVVAILGGWFVWASLGRVYKVLGDPAIKSTINIGLLVVSGIVGLLLIKAVK